MMRFLSFLFIKLFLFGTMCSEELSNVEIPKEPDNVIADKGLGLISTNGHDSGLLIIGTLDGTLIAVDASSGNVKWKHKDGPVVKVSATSKDSILPVFLPDPKDGTLYTFKRAESKSLKKMPFSVQQLVASSPCRSSDGVFYSGKKIDSWFSIDILSGKKLPLLSLCGIDGTCPTTSSTLFVGRTEYNLIMFDSKTSNRFWNITFSDYATRTLNNDQISNYPYLHSASISSGRLRTTDRKTGTILWEKDFKSPTIGIYVRQGQDIISVPFTSIAESTLDSPISFQQDQLTSTLYVGECDNGFYALPSLADQSVPLISDFPNRLLIGGPGSDEEQNSIILGHYLIPTVTKTQLLLTGRSDPIIQTNKTKLNFTRPGGNEEMKAVWNVSSESKILAAIVAVLAIFVIAMFFYIMAQVRDIKQSSHGSSQGQTIGQTYTMTQQGVVIVGKITFDTRQVLGKGCEGTFVFKGTFDGRSVAVKRLLPECFTVADREVQLLRESDAHPNVIRYFSTEEDAQFRYIALELCSATLQDYVEKSAHKSEIDSINLLKQAICGLEHLHSLKIVHRDIKPHNILLAKMVSTNTVRAMISDFGLCKKLQNGRASFSCRSGITGTEGWIAPEMIESNGRVTSSVDIFSMGCVFYYTISNGKHPFGESIRRQSNILNNDHKIHVLEDDLWRCLIARMISNNPNDRPTATTVKKFPVFWDKSLILSFLQDISDRVEKEDSESVALLSLEKGGQVVYKDNWKDYIHPQVAEDLGKYRSYRGDSVRDLLRAFRNKKHHYRELTLEAQQILGTTNESYVNYWLLRFPGLLYHSWTSLQFLREEPALAPYYDNYEFPCQKSDFVPSWFYEKYNIKSTSKSQQKLVKRKQAKEPQDETEMEAWIKTGEQNGAWRPRHREKRKVKKIDTDN